MDLDPKILDMEPRRLTGDLSMVAAYEPWAYDELMKLVAPPEQWQEIDIAYPDGTVQKARGYLSGYVEQQVPDSRWQAFKERWFPTFLLQWFPVRKRSEVSVSYCIDPDSVRVERRP